MAVGNIIRLIRFDKRFVAGKFNFVTGMVDQFEEVAIDYLGTSGFCKETDEGWAAVYGYENELFFQINKKKWKLNNEKTRYSYLSSSLATFHIEDDDISFEISYDHWTEDALMSDLDDPDEDHDFFAYVIWLCKPERFKRVAREWTENSLSNL